VSGPGFRTGGSFVPVVPRTAGDLGGVLGAVGKLGVLVAKEKDE
jgi:hypothetical protein